MVASIHQRTRTEKTLLDNFFNASLVAVFDTKQRFFSLCSLMYINNYSTYDTKNSTVSFIDTWYWCFTLFGLININNKCHNKYTQSLLCAGIDILLVACHFVWVTLCVLCLILLLFHTLLFNISYCFVWPKTNYAINNRCWCIKQWYSWCHEHWYTWRNINWKILINKFLRIFWPKQQFYSLYFIMYINNHSIYVAQNFMDYFIANWKWKCAQCWCIKIDIKAYDKVHATAILSNTTHKV